MIKVEIRLKGNYIGNSIMTIEEIRKAEQTGFTILKIK